MPTVPTVPTVPRTLKGAMRLTRDLGYTVKYFEGEYAAFPRGTNRDNPAAIFETSLTALVETLTATERSQ